MDDKILVKALEVLDKEKQQLTVYEVIHADIEPLLYNADEAALTAIAEGKKTLCGALKAIEDFARKNKKPGQNCACVSDTEGLRIAKEYFGLSEDKPKKSTATTSIFDLM